MKFSLKTLLLFTAASAIAIWALGPTVDDLLAIRNAQAKNISIRNALIEQGHKPQIDWQLGRRTWRQP